jgi:hypothetical protein
MNEMLAGGVLYYLAAVEKAEKMVQIIALTGPCPMETG